MSDSTQPAASPAPATPADRIKGCIKILTGLKPTAEAKADIQFLLGELLDLMQIANPTVVLKSPETKTEPTASPAAEASSISKG